MTISPPEKQSTPKVTTLSPQEQEHLNKVITEILAKYDRQVDKQSVEEFTTQFIQERDTIKDVDNFLGDVNRAFGRLDQINSYHQDLINAQKKGKSKANWLKAIIKSTTNIENVQKIGKIVQEVQFALAQSNNQHLASFLDENVDDVEIFTPMAEREFEGINEQIIVQDLLGEVQNNSLLNIISTAQTIESLSNKTNDFDGNVSKVAQNCFEGELGNNEELLAKKLVTTAVLVADAEFPMEALDGVNASEVAMMVDMGITLSKVAYKVVQGEMSVSEGLEYIADRAIADIGIVIETVAKLKIEYVAAGIGAAVGTVFGPVGMMIGGFVGHGIGKVTGAYIAPKIRQGVQKLREVATPVIKNVVQKVQKTVEKVKEGAKKLWNWLTN
jgi:hypothetical protein